MIDWFFNDLILGCLLPRDLILFASYSACLLQFKTRCAAVAWLVSLAAILYGVIWFDSHEAWMNQAWYAIIYMTGIPFVTRWVTVPLALLSVKEIVGVFDHLLTPHATWFSLSFPYIGFLFGLFLTISLWKDYHDGGRGSTMVSIISAAYRHVFGSQAHNTSVSTKK